MTAVVGLALVAGGAACGGGKGTATANVAADDGTTTTTAPGAAYAACLREHGADVADRPARPDGQGPPSSPPSSRPPGSRPSTSLPAADQAKLAAARQACASLQPADRATGNGPQSQAFQVYASCLKDHGVTLPGGGPGGPGGGPGGPGGPMRDDPAFQAADAICAPLRPAQP